MKILAACVLVLSAAVGFAPATKGDVAVIDASKDATIFQNNVDNGSGGGNGLFAGTNSVSPASPRRGLVAFDLVGKIPVGATILDVQLRLVMGMAPGGSSGNQTIALHRLTSNWGEGTALKVTPQTNSLSGQGDGAPATNGDATWNASFYSAVTPTPWTTPGGDYVASPSATLPVAPTANVAYTWNSPTLLADVQGWYANPSSNNGWLLKNADEATLTNFRAFFSRDVLTVANRPLLTITYSVPEPSGLAICAIAAAAALRSRRQRAELSRG
jgi:hypothetical protein